MNNETREAARRLLAALSRDPQAQRDECTIYGDWAQHLRDQLEDAALETSEAEVK